MTSVLQPIRRSFVLILAAVALGAALGADAPTATRLFDGKSLEGWKQTEFFKSGEVKVEDGAMIFAPGSPMTGVTFAKDVPLRVNYELVYDARRLSGRDFFAAATFPVGKSYATFVNGGWGGSITGVSSLNGADASENETGKYYRYENNRWYRFRIQVTAEVVRCWIDDQAVVAVAHVDRQVATRVESRSSQPLGFASYESGGAVRKVEVRPLSTVEVATANKIEE